MTALEACVKRNQRQVEVQKIKALLKERLPKPIMKKMRNLKVWMP